MGFMGFGSGVVRNLGCLWSRRSKLYWVVFWVWVAFVLLPPVASLRPLRERARSWGDEWLFVKKDEIDLGPFSTWNITGTYRGTWKFPDSTNSSSRFPDFRNSHGNTPIYEMEKHCNVEIAGQVSRVSSTHNGILTIHAICIYKCTFQGAAKVSILMIGQQAIMDAYLCLLHLTAGILVESLFNAFATAAFFKFVVFSIFEMRYLLAIWKASRPTNSGEGWETMRRELSVLYSRFYGILLGGILLMYEFHNFLRPILLLMYSFWIPQIITNVIRDSRKPLHPHYILGMTVTRLAIPLYIFGCPNNFMRIEPDKSWCICLGVFIGLQASILLLQHYLGSRWFIPRQILPEKYSYCRRLDQNTNRTTDCVICMTAVDLTQRSNDRMVTPCDHCFHSGCLQRWMDVKMECPTCRRPLPPA
ncbi:hypothetical protein DVH24_031053 [Malus domestica]|uniref:RING-type E3 ubiquitin transferase n=1 Tax=Malus domestica TaxID=3750 RepID=A0A498HD72_MALDO|nr:hypothetical protein DVH24_031053 [Malus domestica]